MTDGEVPSPREGAQLPVSRDIIVETLDRIVMSEPFVKSPRSRDFLAFVVTETLAGRGHRLKERTVARHALQRPDTFDARADSTVRVQAGRVRAALDAYYEGPGLDCPVRIHLPKGSYVPTFTPMDGRPPASADPSGPPTRTLGPGVVVMEFEHAGDDPAATGLARGLTDSLVRALTRFPGIRVVGPIVRDLGAAGESGERRLGVRLDVQYVLRGTVLGSDDAIRVSVRLVEAATGEIVWSDFIERPGREFSGFGVEDDIALHLAAIIGDYSGVLHRHAAQASLPSSNPTVVAAMRCYYEGLEVSTQEAGAAARAALEEAVALEPDNPQLLAMLASTLSHAAVFASGAEQQEALQRADELAHAALALEPDDSHPHLVLGSVHVTRGNLPRARRELRLAADLAPANPSILYGAGWYLALVGEWDLGVHYVRESTRLNPTRPTFRYGLLAIDRLIAHDYAAALVDATRCSGGDGFWGPLLRALALAGLGHLDEALDELDEARSVTPDFRDRLAWLPELPEHVHGALVDSIDALSAQAGSVDRDGSRSA